MGVDRIVQPMQIYDFDSKEDFSNLSLNMPPEKAERHATKLIAAFPIENSSTKSGKTFVKYSGL